MARDILARTRVRAEMLPHKPKVVAYVAQDPSPATRSYLNIKRRSAEAAGCEFTEVHDPSSFKDADAAIIQLPATPEVMHLLSTSLLEGKDADVLSSAARESFKNGDSDALLPPVVAAAAEILETYGIEPKGKRAVVIGSGFLVGEPMAIWLRHTLARVSVVTESMNLEKHVRTADIIVSGAGAPGIIKARMLKEGVVLIDAGTSESAGEIAGDADPACAPKCSLFTPVPGGVGPVAVAKLFENAVTLAERATKR